MLITELIDILSELQKIVGDTASVRIADQADDWKSKDIQSWRAQPGSVVLWHE